MTVAGLHHGTIVAITVGMIPGMIPGMILGIMVVTMAIMVIGDGALHITIPHGIPLGVTATMDGTDPVTPVIAMQGQDGAVQVTHTTNMVATVVIAQVLLAIMVLVPMVITTIVLEVIALPLHPCAAVVPLAEAVVVAPLVEAVVAQ